MNIWKLILLLGIFALVFYLLLARSSLLLVNHVNLKLDQVDCTDQKKIDQSILLLGRNILTIDQDEIRQIIKSKFPCIGQVYLDKDLPHQLNIKAVGRKPLVEVSWYLTKDATPSSESALIDWSVPETEAVNLVADSNGYVFGKSGNLTLPKLFLPDRVIKLGSKLDFTTLQDVGQILNKLHELRLDNNLPQLKVIGPSLLVLTDPKIAFSLEKEIKLQLASLQLIWHKSTIESSRMELMDLRFDKPVVVFAPQKRS